MQKYKLKNYIEKLKEKKLLQEENISEKLKENIVENLTYDSRECNDKTLFVCKGLNFKE